MKRVKRFAYCWVFILLTNSVARGDGDAIQIGSHRQLFVGQTLIHEMTGVRQVLHHPAPREVVIAPEHPWEAYGVSYMVTFREGDRFRAWYRVDAAPFGKAPRRAMTAYAESDDGVHWHKPKLGIVEYDGSTANNLVWDGKAANMAPFRDGNPACPPNERYKAIVRDGDVFALVSPDGLHWQLASATPILTDRPFDSHNIAFWDEATHQYVAYTRGVRSDGPVGQGMKDRFKGGVRWVRRATSNDFRSWSDLEPIQTGAAPREELYTNATIRYRRAPQFLLMFPSRFASGREPQPGWKFGAGVNDIVFLSSRDGLKFDRTFMEAFIRPGLDQGNWHERSLYMERGILQTSPTELSLYCMQNWRLPSVHIRRYTLRPDGFVSIQAGYQSGEMITRPFIFSGASLKLNYATSAVGWLRVEIQDQQGQPIDGRALEDSLEMFGDKLDAEVRWQAGADVSKLAGREVRLRIVMSDCDLYAFRFGD